MALVWSPAGQEASQINPRYSAPELFALRLSDSCDQYSLALIFYELLTGEPAHANRQPAHLAKVRSTGTETLDLLPGPDRPILSRALHPEPKERFATCTEFICALLAVTPGGEDVRGRDGLSRVEAEMRQAPPPERTFPIRVSEHAAAEIEALVKDLTGDHEVHEVQGVPYFYSPSSGLKHCCHLRLVPGTLKLRLTSFVDQWHVQRIADGGDRLVYQLRLQATMWRRMLGQHPALEIEIRALPPGDSRQTLTQMLIQIRAVGCVADEAAESLQKWGPAMLTNLRKVLQADPDRRRQPRIPYTRSLTARPVVSKGRLGEEMRGQARDISLKGIGLILMGKPPSQLVLRLPPSNGRPPIEVLAQVVHSVPLGVGQHEVGLEFVFEA